MTLSVRGGVYSNKFIIQRKAVSVARSRFFVVFRCACSVVDPVVQCINYYQGLHCEISSFF